MKKIKEKEFYINLIKKTFVMFGFTYFAVALTIGNFTTIIPSLLSAGMYFFTELARYYNFDVSNKKIKYQFLL